MCSSRFHLLLASHCSLCFHYIAFISSIWNLQYYSIRGHTKFSRISYHRTYFCRISKFHFSNLTLRFIFCNILLWDGIVINTMQFYNYIVLWFISFPSHIQVVKSLKKIQYLRPKLSEQTPLRRFCELVASLWCCYF